MLPVPPSLAFLRAVLDGLPEAVVVATPMGEIVQLNAGTEKLFGYARAELLGRSISTLVPPQADRRADPMKWLQRWAQEPDDHQQRFLDLIAQRRSGETMPVEVRVVERYIEGQALYLITVRDNTVRRREQAAFKEANLLATRILQVAEDGIVSTDAQQRITFFNLRAEKMFGYRAEEVLGQPLAMLIPPDARERHQHNMARFGAGKQASRPMAERTQVEGLRRDGERFPMEVAITKVSTGGSLTYTAHLREIGERLAREARLRESERRLRAVFEHAAQAIGLLDAQGTVLEINRSGRALTAGDANLIGRPLWELPWSGRDEAPNEAARQRLRQAIARAAAGDTVSYPTEPLLIEGRPRRIVLTLTPVRDELGTVAYIIPEGRNLD